MLVPPVPLRCGTSLFSIAQFILISLLFCLLFQQSNPSPIKSIVGPKNKQFYQTRGKMLLDIVFSWEQKLKCFFLKILKLFDQKKTMPSPIHNTFSKSILKEVNLHQRSESLRSQCLPHAMFNGYDCWSEKC